MGRAVFVDIDEMREAILSILFEIHATHTVKLVEPVPIITFNSI